MSVKACPVEGCVLLQVGGVNILDFSYAAINRTYESSPKNKMQLQRVQALLVVNSHGVFNRTIFYSGQNSQWIIFLAGSPIKMKKTLIDFQ